MNQLATIDPIPLPDLRRATATPSLPAWLVSQRAAVVTELQPTGTGYRDILVLPPDLMPSVSQRQALEAHLVNLRAFLDQTPINGADWEAETMATVTKMLLVLGGAKATEHATEAKAEAFSVALDDIPSWAVVAVQKRWYRSQCGNDEHGRPYDYRFMPDPASLRRLAQSEVWRLKVQIESFERILAAQPYVDCTAELERGRAAWEGLKYTWRTGGDQSSLTFDRAAEIGRGLNQTEAQ